MTNFNTANTAGINFGEAYAPPSNQTGTLTPYVPDIGIEIGTRVNGSNNSQYVFCVAGEAIDAGMTVSVDEDFTALKITAALAGTGQFIGVAQATLANTYYGWVAVGGSNIDVLVATAAAQDVALWTTSTAGVLDDASSSVEVRIDGIVIVASNQSSIAGLVEGIISWPRSASV